MGPRALAEVRPDAAAEANLPVAAALPAVSEHGRRLRRHPPANRTWRRRAAPPPAFQKRDVRQRHPPPANRPGRRRAATPVGRRVSARARPTDPPAGGVAGSGDAVTERWSSIRPTRSFWALALVTLALFTD